MVEAEDAAIKKGQQTIIQMRGDIVKAFIEGGCNLNVQDQLGRTPFYLVCSVCDDTSVHLHPALEIARCLYQANADVRKANYNGTTPAMVAAERGHLRILHFLLEEVVISVNDLNENCDSILIAAARRDQDEIVEYLISRGVNINHQNNQGVTALIAICEAPSDTISDSDTYFQHREVLRKSAFLLLDQHASVDLYDVDEQTAVHKAAKYGHKYGSDHRM